MNTTLPSIVLVHGAFADGTGWKDVFCRLTADGFDVSIVQNPTATLAGDVQATLRVVAARPAPVVLVGHSYGGAVITEAGTDSRVAGLVYLAAFVPDQDESVQTLIEQPVPGFAAPPILPPQDGFLLLDRDGFRAAFAADLEADTTDFMAASQTPWGLEAIGGKINRPAWRSKPSWYIVATDDHMIPPPAQRAMAQRAGATVVELASSHAVYMSHADAVATLIATAARSLVH